MKLQLCLLTALLCTCLAIEFDNVAIESAQYGACCVEQDPPVVTVEKLMIQAKTRQVTQQQRISAKCGVFGWDVCTRYTARVVPQQYYVQLYTHNTKYPPCKRYACCHGFQQVINKCIMADKFKDVVTLLADWRSKNPDADLRAGLADLLKREKILG